jgi:hypothetical protein
MGFGRTATVADGLLPLFGGPRLGGVSWRTNLADLFGGPRWRCRPWRPRLEPRRISDLRCDEHRVSDGVVWALAFGALRLALSDWRSHLAVSVGGVSWRCQLAVSVGGPRWRCLRWRCGFEPRPINEIRCEDRQVAGSPVWTPAVGALWLAHPDWRRTLAVSVGRPVWRT